MKNCQIDPKHIPSSVTHLFIEFDGDFSNFCACEAAHYEEMFGISYDCDRLMQHLHVGDVPESVSYLALNFDFDQRHCGIPVGAIPSSVTHLSLGPSFTSEYPNTDWISKNITHISFGCEYFDEPIHLPRSVYCVLFTEGTTIPEMINPPSRIEFLSRSNSWWIT